MKFLMEGKWKTQGGWKNTGKRSSKKGGRKGTEGRGKGITIEMGGE